MHTVACLKWAGNLTLAQFIRHLLKLRHHTAFAEIRQFAALTRRTRILRLATCNILKVGSALDNIIYAVHHVLYLGLLLVGGIARIKFKDMLHKHLAGIRTAAERLYNMPAIVCSERL